MAIRHTTLRLLRSLIVTIGDEVDQTTRQLTRAWIRAWDELAPAWRLAIAELAARAVENGRWPAPWELQRIEALRAAMFASQDALARLGRETGVSVVDSAGRVIHLAAEHEPRLIASQLPAAEQPAALARFAGRIAPRALDAIVARTAGQIESVTRPLAPAAVDAMQRALVRGVAVGDNPRAVARDMMQRTRGAFDGGLTRATVIARTEMLDAYRAASGYAHQVNADVLAGWVWICALDRRSCPACWAMHGRVFPLSQPGPWDHQQGRCTRAPKTLSWADLGITGIKEPPDAIPDAKAKFDALPEDQKISIMGKARYDAYRSGRLAWDDIAVMKVNPGWRPSYVPRSVRDIPQESAPIRPGLLVVAGR